MAIVRTYTQNGYVSPANPQLDPETYKRVLLSWVKACVDAVLWFPDEGTYKMVLGKRKILPQKDWWIFGGRELPDESPQEAIVRKLALAEEIGLNVALHRIEEATFVHKYKWADDGSSVRALTFVVEITKGEYEQMQTNLSESPEYDELAALEPMVLHENQRYHQAVWDCAAELVHRLEKRY